MDSPAPGILQSESLREEKSLTSWKSRRGQRAGATEYRALEDEEEEEEEEERT
jgi:hypothetical protein